MIGEKMKKLHGAEEDNNFSHKPRIFLSERAKYQCP
jgi:hypothetical protein